MPGPLHGIRVLDLTSVMLGPYATQMLGDLGAEVIKVESNEGDPIRQVGPGRSPGMAATFINLGRNKKSVLLDLKTPAGLESALRLAETCDVLAHNMRPAAMARLGLGYEPVRARKPDIIYAEAFGFAQEGPYADQPAFDDTIQAMAGLAHAQAAFGGEPAYHATIPADKTVAVYFVSAILAALFHRQRTGEGQKVEVSMFETMAGWMLAEHLYGAAFEPAMTPPIYPRVVSPHRRPYRTLDGYVALVAYNDRQWLRLFEAAGRPELLDDPRFATVAARTSNVDALYSEVAAIAATRTTQDCLRIFGEADVPVVPLMSTSDLLRDPHLASIGFFQIYDHVTEGQVRHVASPFRFSRTPVSVRSGAPRLGEHTQEVLAQVGGGGR